VRTFKVAPVCRLICIYYGFMTLPWPPFEIEKDSISKEWSKNSHFLGILVLEFRDLIYEASKNEERLPQESEEEEDPLQECK